MHVTHIIGQIRPQRGIEGLSAVLLPFTAEGRPDWDGLAAHIARVYAAGLTPAVNMDTGYVNLLTAVERLTVLQVTQELAMGRPFIAGAFVEGQPGDMAGNYARALAEIQQHGGTPIIFQCSAMQGLTGEDVVAVYGRIAADCERCLAFELGTMFAPFGRIYSLEVVEGLLGIPQIVGLKHSSLRRETEWARLALRDRVRPDFKIYTGNDLAIDMVMYGSDYLLGLSTFAPDYFARRDAFWQAGDARFYELNDMLQYLGQFAFRLPTAAYKHSAAQFLHLRGWLADPSPHPRAPRRPESDRPILQAILEELARFAP